VFYKQVNAVTVNTVNVISCCRLQEDPPAGVSGAPTDNNIMLWNAVIFGYAFYTYRHSNRESVGVDMVGCSAPSVCLSVCPRYNSKTNYAKVFKLGTGILGYLGIFLKRCGFGVERSKIKVTASISAYFTLVTMLMHIWLTTEIRHGFELYECLLVYCYY